MKLVGSGKLIFAIALTTVALTVACSPTQDTDKTRQQAADAAEHIKEGSKVAAANIKKGAVEAGKQGRAIAEGVKQGWTEESKKVNVNTASKSQLLTLSGIDDDAATRIIKGRPYHTKDELNTKGIVTPDQFQQIQGQIKVN